MVPEFKYARDLLSIRRRYVVNNILQANAFVQKTENNRKQKLKSNTKHMVDMEWAHRKQSL